MCEDNDKRHSLDKEIKRNINFLETVLNEYKKINLKVGEFITGQQINTKAGTNQDILRDAFLQTAKIKDKDVMRDHEAAKEILFSWCLIYCEGVLKTKCFWDDSLKDKALLASHDAVMDAFKALRNGINEHFQNNPKEKYRDSKGKGGIRAYLGTVMENAYKKQKAGIYTAVCESDKKDFERRVSPKAIGLVEISESEADYLIKKENIEVISPNEYKRIAKTQSSLNAKYKTIIVKEEIICKTSSGTKTQYRYFRPEWQSRTTAMELENSDKEIYAIEEVNQYVIKATCENAKLFMAKDILNSIIEYMSSKKLLSDLELEFLDRYANDGEKPVEIEKDWINRGVKIKGNTIGNFKNNLITKIQKELCKDQLWNDLISD